MECGSGDCLGPTQEFLQRPDAEPAEPAVLLPRRTANEILDKLTNGAAQLGAIGEGLSLAQGSRDGGGVFGEGGVHAGAKDLFHIGER